MNEKTELIYHAMRSRELAADAVSMTVKWDPMGAVCAWSVAVLGELETHLEECWDIGDDDVDCDVICQELHCARSETRPISCNDLDNAYGARLVKSAWERVISELSEIAGLGYEWPEEIIRYDIQPLITDHVECNINESTNRRD